MKLNGVDPKLSAPRDYHQVEHSIRTYDGAKLTWQRRWQNVQWGPWILIRVNGKGPIT